MMNIQNKSVFDTGVEPRGDGNQTPQVSAKLTHLQLHVLRGLADGDTYEEIADELQVSLQTIQSILRAARVNLGSTSEGHAIAILMREGVLS